MDELGNQTGRVRIEGKRGEKTDLMILELLGRNIVQTLYRTGQIYPPGDWGDYIPPKGPDGVLQ